MCVLCVVFEQSHTPKYSVVEGDDLWATLFYSDPAELNCSFLHQERATESFIRMITKPWDHDTCLYNDMRNVLSPNHRGVDNYRLLVFTRECRVHIVIVCACVRACVYKSVCVCVCEHSLQSV